ncbi:hypothetical protein GQ53DRAFT_754010 [Thozetella sp. PMI_491]|nr:hypothetical protein GQ53DRAFT_754010 [Thozetella sp. PMI_491]
MHSSIYICVVSAILISAGQAVTAPIPGYTVTDFTWEMEVFPGSPKENFTGTAEEVIAQLKTINPNWETDFNVSESVKQRSELEKRLNFPFTSVLCNIRVGEWGQTSEISIGGSIELLDSMGGQPSNGPGPGACARASCNLGAGVWWCNDETQALSLPGFSTIAAGVSAILRNCPSNSPTNPVLNGQVFAQFLQNWNVIVNAKC